MPGSTQSSADRSRTDCFASIIGNGGSNANSHLKTGSSQKMLHGFFRLQYNQSVRDFHSNLNSHTHAPVPNRRWRTPRTIFQFGQDNSGPPMHADAHGEL